MIKNIYRTLTLQERIEVLVRLGAYLAQNDERTQAHVHRASVDNPWFTEDFIRYAIAQITDRMLQHDDLDSWTAGLKEPPAPQQVGVIMAGNIPLVGFHDLLCVFISGHRAIIKLSDKDKYLIPYLITRLGELDPRTKTYFEIVDQLKEMEAVIATGSNNSARYFEYYFGKYPNLIRRNRNAVAVLDGSESDKELAGLCDDIFLYFGMGCRSVSHISVPEGYDFAGFIAQAERYAHLAQHTKYKNNLDYNLALCILNKTPHHALQHLVLIERPDYISPVSTLYYSTYAERAGLQQKLSDAQEEIQCVVSNKPFQDLPNVEFGEAQQPGLADYADGIDTLAFLQTLTS